MASPVVGVNTLRFPITYALLKVWAYPYSNRWWRFLANAVLRAGRNGIPHGLVEDIAEAHAKKPRRGKKV